MRTEEEADEVTEAMLRVSSIMQARMAIEHVSTIIGAERIFRAERRGLNRPEVLRTAARRIEVLGGSQAERTYPLLELKGQIVEPGELDHTLKPQIVVPETIGGVQMVSGVARMKRHPKAFS